MFIYKCCFIAVANICGSVFAAYIILEIIDFEPTVRQFLIAMIIAFLSIRVTWILYSDLVINVLLGYDLDKALQLKKMAWSILHVGLISSAAKVVGHGAEELVAGSTLTGSTSDESYTKAMAKFSKSKNGAELQYEIDKIKKEITERQAELACLENMKFASSGSGSKNSSSSHRKNSSRAEESCGP